MRLFFALWPPQPTALALHEWAVRAQRIAGGRAIRGDTIHLTLAFLGEQTEARAEEAIVAARTIRFAGHNLVMDQAAFRRRKEIVWAQPSETPPALAGLAAGLRAALVEAGFTLENRPFAAHVTLLRKSRGGKLPPLPAADWPVTEFSLTRSVLGAQGARYESLERFGCSA